MNKFTFYLTAPVAALGFYLGDAHHFFAGVTTAGLFALGMNKVRKLAQGRDTKPSSKVPDLLG